MFRDEVIKRIGFVTYKRTTAAAALIIGFAATGALSLRRQGLLVFPSEPQSDARARLRYSDLI